MRDILINNDVDPGTINEILIIFCVTLYQNYFYFPGKHYVQEDGLATRSPTNSSLSESHIQYSEHYYITTILNEHNT